MHATSFESFVAGLNNAREARKKSAVNQNQKEKRARVALVWKKKQKF